jgi:hypothetical protein
MLLVCAFHGVMNEPTHPRSLFTNSGTTGIALEVVLLKGYLGSKLKCVCCTTVTLYGHSWRFMWEDRQQITLSRATAFCGRENRTVFVNFFGRLESPV